MGLLRRLLSLGSKKDKKKRPVITHNVPVQDARVRQEEDEDYEAAVGRLLRSSSARYAVVREFDYNTLPPLPHPINSVIQPPGSSAVSIASSTISTKGTYTVTVHGRKRHTSTEFPNANSGLGVENITTRRSCASTPPEDSSRALRLRSDPSVLSLVDMYDEHGRLPSKAFSNSPPPSPKEGKAQCKRSGSTLRQLLGAPDSLSSRDGNGADEGDISWAERFLGENGSVTSVSSAGLPTPRTPDGSSFDDSLPRPNVLHDITISTDNENSHMFDNPTISSMDVELSITSDDSAVIIDPIKEEEPPKVIHPATPRRASQVFGFLTDRRRSKNLPDPPSVFSTPSDDGCSRRDLRSHFSDTSSECGASLSNNSATPRPSDTHRNSRRISTSSISRPMPLSKRSSRASLNSNSQHTSRPRRESFVPDITYDHIEDEEDNEDPHIQQARKVKVIMSGPTKVIVTAPTPSQNTPSRIPRGPRAPRRRSTSGGHRPRPVMLTERSNTIVSRPSTRETHIPTPSSKRKISGSHKSSSTILSENDHLARRNESLNSRSGSENRVDLGLFVKTEIPLTPLRTNSSASPHSPLYRTAVSRDIFRPPAGMTPSPASTSLMSPVGGQLMTDIRQQRMAAREADRDKTGMRYTQRSGSTRSPLRV